MIAAPTTRNFTLADDGFEIFFAVLPPRQCEVVAADLSDRHTHQRMSTRNNRGGLRNLLRAPMVAEIAASDELNTILTNRLQDRFVPTRALFFDKTPDANWFVPWHQDLMIPIGNRIDTSGFEDWCIKNDVLHVQPPQQILENLVTVRLHLDHCTAGNGAVKVIPRSHCHGKLRGPEIAAWTATNEAVTCEMPMGGALLMRPLLLHSSATAESPSHRRVLDIQFASCNLPNGLHWLDR